MTLVLSREGHNVLLTIKLIQERETPHPHDCGGSIKIYVDFDVITKTTGHLGSELCELPFPFCYGLCEPRQNAKVICEI